MNEALVAIKEVTDGRMVFASQITETVTSPYGKRWAKCPF